MLTGSIAALITPMQVSGALDLISWTHLLEWHVTQGTEAVVILGTTGESATTEDQERITLIRSAVRHIHGRIPVWVGTGSASTQQAIARTQQAKELGADGALIVTPYYNKPTQEGLYQHFKAIADAVAFPQIVYNVPFRTGCDLLPETAVRLSHIEHIVGIKDATAEIKRVVYIVQHAPQFLVLSGDDATACDWMLHGAKGVISVAANAVPQQMRALCDHVRRGAHQSAVYLSNALSHLSRALCVESNPIPIKWLLHQMNMIPAGIRLPLLPLSELHHDVVWNAWRTFQTQCCAVQQPVKPYR